MSTTKTKLRSLELYLSAHPDNEENSECADRLSDVEELLQEIPDNESALIKRNEELEAMLEKCKSLFDQRQLPYERDCVEFSKEITELLNKPK